MVAILVLLTVAVVLTARLVSRGFERTGEAYLSAAASAEAVSAHPFLHPGHTWARLDTTGEAKVGIDNFLLKVLGKVDRVYLPEPGQAVRQGEKVFAVFRNGRRLALPSPIEGVVAAVNSSASLSSPGEALSRNGWLFTIRPRNLARSLENVKNLDAASPWLDAEAKRFSSFLVAGSPRLAEVGVTLQDGGNYPTGVIEKMDSEQVRNFEREFLG